MPVTIQDTKTTRISGVLAGQWLRSDHDGLVTMRRLMPDQALAGERGLFTIQVTHEKFQTTEMEGKPCG